MSLFSLCHYDIATPKSVVLYGVLYFGFICLLFLMSYVLLLLSYKKLVSNCGGLVAKSCLIPCDSMDLACQVPLSMRFPRE